MRPVRAFLFDLDGTLIDSRADIAAAANAALAPLGVGPFAVEEVVPYVGRGAAALLASLLRQPDIQVPAVQEAVQRFIAYYAHHLTVHTRPYPGVVEALDHFREVPLFVVSNKPERLARGVLEALGLAARFQAIYGGESFPRKKPDPLPILETIRPFDWPASQVVMVGDSVMDIEAGRRAGVTTCGVLYGLGLREELSSAGPDLLIDDALELTRWFEPAPA